MYSKIVIITSCVLFFNIPTQAISQTSDLYTQEQSQISQAPLNVDFSTYQRDIDNLFEVALMHRPTMNSSINSVILNINRKITENPENPTPLISLGHVYRLLGQLSEANKFYEKALSLDPDNFHLNVFSALTASQIPAYEKALERLDKAVKLNPMDLYAWMTRGRVLMLLKKDEQALESFEKALELDPKQKQVAFAKSLIYQRSGQDEKAVDVLEKLREENPEDLFIQYHLGALAFARKDAAKALEHWHVLFLEGTRDTQFLFNLSMAYLENNEPEKAETILKHLQFFLPGETDVDLMRAETYRQMNRLDEAERRFRVLLAENPGHLSAHMGLAHVLDALGKTDERDAVLQQAAVFSQREQALTDEKQKMKELREQLFTDPDALVEGSIFE